MKSRTTRAPAFVIADPARLAYYVLPNGTGTQHVPAKWVSDKNAASAWLSRYSAKCAARFHVGENFRIEER